MQIIIKYYNAARMLIILNNPCYNSPTFVKVINWLLIPEGGCVCCTAIRSLIVGVLSGIALTTLIRLV